MTITGFTRSSAEIVSQPVDIVLLARLTAAGGDARALIKRGDDHRRAGCRRNLAPLGPGRGWSDRLMSAPLSGGIRYNGPAGVLFSLTGLANQQASGGIAVAADFGGRSRRAAAERHPARRQSDVYQHRLRHAS